jgi:hypothetical protein
MLVVGCHDVGRSGGRYHDAGRGTLTKINPAEAGFRVRGRDLGRGTGCSRHIPSGRILDSTATHNRSDVGYAQEGSGDFAFRRTVTFAQPLRASNRLSFSVSLMDFSSLTNPAPLDGVFYPCPNFPEWETAHLILHGVELLLGQLQVLQNTTVYFVGIVQSFLPTFTTSTILIATISSVSSPSGRQSDAQRWLSAMAMFSRRWKSRRTDNIQALLTTNYEPKSPSRRTGDQPHKKFAVIRDAP